MNIHIKPLVTLAYGPIAIALVGVFSPALAQEEAIRDYDVYLAGTQELPRSQPDANAAVTDLERRINCLELTRLPCERKALVTEIGQSE